MNAKKEIITKISKVKHITSKPILKTEQFKSVLEPEIKKQVEMKPEVKAPPPVKVEAPIKRSRVVRVIKTEAPSGEVYPMKKK